MEEESSGNRIAAIMLSVYWVLYVLLMGFWTKDCVPEDFVINRLASVLHLHLTQITNSRQWIIPVLSKRNCVFFTE